LSTIKKKRSASETEGTQAPEFFGDTASLLPERVERRIFTSQESLPNPGNKPVNICSEAFSGGIRKGGYYFFWTWREAISIVLISNFGKLSSYSQEIFESFFGQSLQVGIQSTKGREWEKVQIGEVIYIPKGRRIWNSRRDCPVPKEENRAKKKEKPQPNSKK